MHLILDIKYVYLPIKQNMKIAVVIQHKHTFFAYTKYMYLMYIYAESVFGKCCMCSPLFKYQLII